MPVKEKKTSRAEFAYDTLKRRILDNQLPPGAMLSEVALAQKLNMSRTPIREALKMLMRDDLVEIRDGVGTFVKSATQKDIEDAVASVIVDQRHGDLKGVRLTADGDKINVEAE